MDDAAMSVAQAALVKASEAVTQIVSHERECARRYGEVADKMDGMDGKMDGLDAKLDRLVEQSSIQRGRTEANRALLGNIPNALWSVVIAGAGAGVVILATQLLKGHGS